MLVICLALINDDEDKKSFEQLVKKFEKKLYTESFKILRSHELAEEAVWETFYRIADNFHKIHNLPVYKMEAYLIITIRNASYRLYNKEKKHFYNDIHEEMRDIPSADEFNDYNVADLSKAISELEEKYKVAITYFYYYGHNADETAKLMGVSRNAVYKYLRKAEQILFEKLRGDISE